ncbi:50S ribosomal protein L11 methyltransferase [Candidatus Albibeggiatoa sp. nov. BB20]|uniref:50S ribosomal protein L11 methyltransferase n=1 Tax=Candidatus Albibeggiatoa sp. nov. BB20 TaxID=3162723 RepID=UPI00336537AD
MAWLQITFTLTADKVDTLSSVLEKIGAASVTFLDAKDQPIYEPELNTTPLWQQTEVVALFEQVDNLEQILDQIKQEYDSIPTCHTEIIEDQDWTRVWMDEFQPMRFGQRTWICPSWQTPPEPDDINILLDPGMAFGTGTHETTALCLEWLDQHADLIKDKILIDYGSGSGILAIAALKLGAKQVWCTDIDLQALIATRDNAKNNGVEAGIEVCLANDFQPFQADALLANILANPLMGLAESFHQYLKPNAPLVLSGILNTQTEAVIESYEPYFVIDGVAVKQDWCRIAARRVR